MLRVDDLVLVSFDEATVGALRTRAAGHDVSVMPPSGMAR
jgi:hypothetical protein